MKWIFNTFYISGKYNWHWNWIKINISHRKNEMDKNFSFQNNIYSLIEYQYFSLEKNSHFFFSSLLYKYITITINECNNKNKFLYSYYIKNNLFGLFAVSLFYWNRSYIVFCCWCDFNLRLGQFRKQFNFSIFKSISRSNIGQWNFCSFSCFCLCTGRVLYK